MFGLLETLFEAAGDARGLAISHGIWMTWNLVLAVVPVLLAFALFRVGIERTKLWWFGVCVFVLFLPNAPYVLTDVIHLFDDIRGSRSDLQVLGEFLPLYLLFITIGMGCYVVALDRLWRYVKHERPDKPWWPVETSLHLLCALGIYLGRVVRLNSWHVFTRPRSVLASADVVVGPIPIALIACTFVVLVLCTMLTRAVMYSLVRWARGFRGRLQSAT